MKKVKLTKLSKDKMKVIKGKGNATVSASYCSACQGCDAISMRGVAEGSEIRAAICTKCSLEEA